MDAPLPSEIVVLALSVLLLVFQTLLQGNLATRERGLDWNAGPRDGESKPLGTYAGRAQRALDNFKETYPAFLALALALAVTDRSGGMGAIGAWVWFCARLGYVPLYLFGVPYVLSVVYVVSMIGIALMLARLVF